MLCWHYQWGTALPIWQKLVDEGKKPPPMPQEFFEQPEIEPHLHNMWTAIIDLGTERQIGMGIGPIPASKIREYGRDELGLSGDGHDRFCQLIRNVDSGYLPVLNAPRKTEDVEEKDADGVRRPLHGRRVKAKKAK